MKKTILVIIVCVSTVRLCAAPVPTVVWSGDLYKSHLVDGHKYVIVPGAGNSVDTGNLVIGSNSVGGTIKLPENVGDVSVLIKYKNLTYVNASSPCSVLAVTDSAGHELGVYYEGSEFALQGAWSMGNGSANGGRGWAIPNSPTMAEGEGYVLFSYGTLYGKSGQKGVSCYTGSRISELSGGNNSGLCFSAFYIDSVSIAGGPSNDIGNPCMGLEIEEIAVFMELYLTPADVADYMFPANKNLLCKEALSIYYGDPSYDEYSCEYSESFDGTWRRGLSELPIGDDYSVWVRYQLYGEMVLTNVALVVAQRPVITIDGVRRNDPWDGTLAIDYTVDGDVNALDDAMSSRMEVSARDVFTGKEYTAEAEYIQGDLNVASGRHSFVWNIGDQTGLAGDSAFGVTVSCNGIIRIVDSKSYRGTIVTAEDRSDTYRVYGDETCRIQYYLMPEGKVGIVSVEHLRGDILKLGQICGMEVVEITEGALLGVPRNVKCYFNSAPDGLSQSGLANSQIIYSSRYASSYRPSVRIMSSKIRETDTTILDTVYRVDCALPTVKVRALAFEDGERSFAKVVRPETFIDGTAINIGDEIIPNQNYSLSWKVSADWQTRLAKVKFEVLVEEGELLPLELRTIPASDQYGRMEFSRNTISDSQVFNALLWLYADKDPGLTLSGGLLRGNGVNLVNGYELAHQRYDWSTDYWDNDYRINATRYVLSKMGYNLLSGAALNYVNEETRLGLSPSGVRQYAYKIVEDGE